MRNTLLAVLLVTSSTIYAQSYQSNGFGGNVWSNFNHEFQQFSNEMREMQNKSIFGARTNRYFDNNTNSYIIEIKIDGLAKKNLDITTKDNMIHIAGRVYKTEKTADSSRSSSRQFAQSYSLPNDANGARINAEFKNNALIISIPKLAIPKQNINKITIK
jgi:HSP20 family protein